MTRHKKPIRPRYRSLATSGLLHALVVGGVLLLPAPSDRRAGKPRERIDIVFLRRPSATPVALAEPPAPAARPAPEPPRRALRLPVPPVAAPPAIARRESPPAPRVEPELRPAPAEPPVAAPTLRAGGFDLGPTGAPERRPAATVTALGSFAQSELALPRENRGPRRIAPAQTTFATPAGSSRTAEPARGIVTGTSFASTVVDEAAPPRSPGTVQRGGFADGVGQVDARREPQRSVEALDTPVEIVSKPRPAYTAEARRLGVEGEVVLEVTFVTSGQLHVLRVIEGLGHGLDEAAIEAARGIEFKPAKNNGRPVDHTATLRVVFQLT